MQPSSEPTSTAPGLEKRGFERSDRPLSRRIDDQDSRHRRCARQSAGGEPHRRTRSRRNAGPQVLTQKIEPAALLADKGYDSDGFIEHLEVRRIKPVIPPRANRKTPRECDFALYRERNLVERFFNNIKHFRAIATRYEKTARNFLAGVHLVCALAQMTTGPRTRGHQSPCGPG